MSAQINGISIEKEKIIDVMINYDGTVYSPEPDWISGNPHYSTGAALADFNKDGWLDLVVADGNDMSKGYVNLYYNSGEGTFPTESDWQSDDEGFNGHLDVADVNGDGWPDVAVSYLGTGNSFGPIARVYLNNNGILSSEPDWEADIRGNSFGVDFGDMNNDGRPDLAVATGWSYRPQRFYNNYVFLNNEGTLETTASWQSDDENHYQGILWVDADNDGWMDLVGTGTECEIHIYHNQNGNLESISSWQTTDSALQDGIMLTVGDVTNDGILDLFATDNIQLGGEGYFRQYTGIENGFFENTYSWNYFGGYGSAVALADVNGDNKLDLTTGAWWDYTRIFLNSGNNLETTPSWYSEYSSVNEKIVFGDVGPTLADNKNIIEEYQKDGDRRLFYLSKKPIQEIVSVKCDSKILSNSEFTYSREHGWITINCDLIDTLQIEYIYSRSLDMIVSNWDPGLGNFLYYNNMVFEDLESDGTLVWSDVKPGSTITGEFTVYNAGDENSLLSWEIIDWPNWGTWSFSPIEGDNFTPEDGFITIDVNVEAPTDQEQEFIGSITLRNKENFEDLEIIEVSVTTPKSNNFERITSYLEQFPMINQLINMILKIYNF